MPTLISILVTYVKRVSSSLVNKLINATPSLLVISLPFSYKLIIATIGLKSNQTAILPK